MISIVRQVLIVGQSVHSVSDYNEMCAASDGGHVLVDVLRHTDALGGCNLLKDDEHD